MAGGRLVAEFGAEAVTPEALERRYLDAVGAAAEAGGVPLVRPR